MCGRAYETYTNEELNLRYIRGSPSPGIPRLEAVYNLCPTMNSTVLRLVDGERRFTLMYWQLIPFWEPQFKTKLSTINARSEGIFGSELFGNIVVRQRCIVPISGMPHAAYRLLCRAPDYAESLKSLRVVTFRVTISPYDSKGLLKSAIRDDDPVIFMESEVTYGEKGEVPEEE